MTTDQLDLNTTFKAIVEAAREHRFISYGELAKANGAIWKNVRYKMNTHLGDLVRIASERDWPMPSSIVVNQSNLKTGTLDGTARQGFITAAREYGFDVDDPAAFVKQQQDALFAWAPTAPNDLGLPESHAETDVPTGGPKFVQLFGPVLDALRAFGGSAEPRQIMDKVVDLADITDEELSEKTKKGQSRYENQISFARFYLAKAGMIESKKRGVWLLTPEGRETYLNHESAIAIFKEVQSRFRNISVDDEEAPPEIENEVGRDPLDDPNRKFWFVGALWGGFDDQTDRFLKEGIWQNGYDKKFSEHVARIKPGDWIAIKATFVKKYGLPFDNHNTPVSSMRIKAVGTVTEATKDGKTVKVDWTPLADAKEWYFYTYRVTIVEADVSDDLARRLVRFTFGDEKQDYDYWLRLPYWAKKYSKAPDTVSDLQIAEEEAEADTEEAAFEPYAVPDIVSEGCFLPEVTLTDALSRLVAKKNLILQGPPGTGKTWLAKRLAYALIGTRDRKVTRKRMRAIQFHPSLSYEDFVRGWRPDGNGQLKLTDGVFLEAIEAARAERDRPFVVIIEEINRGNPSQIFGEMLTLLETDKRREDEAIELAYRSETGERVYIPDNLYVIGTMNIADRSLALVDLALRRRFAFITLEALLNDLWKAWCVEKAGMDAVAVEDIRRLMCELNKEIASDRALGAQFKVGHSYVTPGNNQAISDTRKWFRQVVETEISPLLEEYWFDNPDKAASSTRRLLDGI
ncbi:AAA family ATPase [Paracoccus benzoatiresistens]|uniref:AAA family ATPase n=1 Tax=Paracoccus benzoatiresistens TaxID=2997341 RepID=A0ABT4J8S1_9RHOB|nr:AAA family ATPase [Paracoccus sp. EF6]MCZ0963510.1 AAA family ATPase [Paracoccus sp. EF6]